MSQMIGVIFENGESAVELLEQNDTREFVGQSHLSEGEGKRGVAARIRSEAVGGANGEQERYGVQLLALQERGELFGGKLLAWRIEENELVAFSVLLALTIASCQRQNCGLVFQSEARNLGIAGDSFQILVA
jgi:hypothetical protein